MRDALINIVGEAGLIDQADDMQPYLTEWRDRYQGTAAYVVRPASTEQVADVVRLCSEHGIAIVPQGGNTGLCGGAIPDGSGEQIVLSLNRMNKIRSVSPDDFSIVADAGCTLQQLQQAADDAGLFFPLSLAAEGSCHIGGNLSTNAGGINVLRYGTARQQALGIEAVLPNGEVIHGLRSLRKDTAGYDLKQLFIGAEGTLGIITGACLRLVPKPGDQVTVMCALESVTDAVALLATCKASFSDQVLAFEVLPDIALKFVTQHIENARSPFDSSYPWYVLTSIAADMDSIEESFAEQLEASRISNAVIAKSEEESAALWHIRHNISASQKPEGGSLKHDISVPVGRVGDFILEAEDLLAGMLPGARPVFFGHVGDGNVHLNISQPIGGDEAAFLGERERVAEAVYELVDQYGGSFSAEHGVGQARRAALLRHRGGPEVETMRAIKAALDPKGIMNPGKVI